MFLKKSVESYTTEKEEEEEVVVVDGFDKKWEGVGGGVVGGGD